MLSAGAPVIAMASEQTHIICFGNALHGDDGFGPTVYTHLGETALPPGVRLFCADTAGVGALALASDAALAALAARVEVSGETVFFYTAQARPLLSALEAHPQLRTLHRPANLEDLFLKLTGRQIREEG